MPMIAKCASSRSRSPAKGKSMKVVKTPRGGTVSGDMVALLDDRTLSQQARQQVDAERQDDRIEEEGDDAVAESQAAHDATGDLHVGDLAGHADDEGEIEKVPVVGILLAGEAKAARHPRAVAGIVGVAVEAVRIMDGKKQVGESPGQQDRAAGEDLMANGGPAGLLLGIVQDETDRQQAGSSGEDHQ